MRLTTKRWLTRRGPLAVAASLILSLVVAAAGDVVPASATGTYTTTPVSGTFQLNGITCVSATTCVAVGSSSSQHAAAVEIVNGVPGTVATSTDLSAFRLDKIVCQSATACLATGIGTGSGGAAVGEVIPITLNGQATLGTPQYVSGVYELFGLACSSATTCVAVGGTSGGLNGQGAVVDINNGVVGTVQTVSGVLQFLAVGCPSATKCIAVASYTNVATVIITNGTPGTPQQATSNTQNVSAVACSATSCVAVGSDGANHVAAYSVISTTGSVGASQHVAGADSLDAVQCPNATCVAAGSAPASGSENGALVAFTPGSTAPAPVNDPDSYAFSGVYCTTALSCQVTGSSSTASSGIIATADLTLPTATVSGTVHYTDKNGTKAVEGSPLQACATDRSVCASGVMSSADGTYSFTVPAGETYILTAFSPAADSYNPGLSDPVNAATAGTTYSGNDITLTPGPGLGDGVTVTGNGGQQTAGTTVPTVNWSRPFGVNLAPSVFDTPTGDTSTLLTLVITGTNTQTGTVQSVTVYAGGEITVNGQAAAIGLPVDPTNGVSIQVPPLQPIHGPISMAITYSSSPVPATGVTAGPAPLVLTNGNPTEPVTVAASDVNVDHTVGTPTLSGTDKALFSIGTPNCSGATLVQNTSGTSPNQSCRIPVTWHAPTTPSKNTYQATINVPVTNSSGKAGVLQDQIYACDSRIQGNSQCNQSTPPPPPTPTPNSGPIGSLYVDPSGVVETPVAGGGTAPVSGATVTLSMKDTSTSTYSVVPNDSAIMSPDNRTNPDTTGADGAFGWDTIAGTYEISASKSGCTNSPQTTDPITVPPPATGIVITLDCTASQAATTTGIAVSPASPMTGDAVTLAASIAGTSPTGTVSFTDGSTDLGTASVDSSTGKAILSLGSLAPGSHTITASYSGDAGNAPSTKGQTVAVTAPAKVATSTTATARPTASTKGESVTYSATVTPSSGSAEPSGSAAFSIGGTKLCTVVLSSDGPGSPATATCKSTTAPVGANTVTATYSGDSSFTGSSGTAAESVTLPALSVKTSSLAAGAKGKPYRATLAHAGGGGTYKWSVASGKLPAGLKLSAAGKLTGTPSKAGSSSFVIKVSDSESQTATKKLKLTIAEIAIKTTSLKAGKVGTKYAAHLAHYGGSGELTWGHRGALPKGLRLSKFGVLSGNPSKAGTFTVVITLKDHTGATATQRLKLVIK